MKTLGFLVVAVALILPFNIPAADNPVIVHEWGTFTCLQDEKGRAIGGINVDDEPVPNFVCGAGFVRGLAQRASGFGLPPYFNQTKGWRPADRDVTMRLETPVIYFYPPPDEAARSVPPLDVHVDFHGGVLSQYYPYAEASGWSVNFPIVDRPIGDITSALDWKQVRLGSSEKPVETDDKVWTTPREVNASLLEVPAQVYNGKGGVDKMPQAEHFLFYRGIGHIDSPLRLQDGDGALGVWPQGWSGAPMASPAWLVEIQADGSCAYREITQFEGAGSWWRPTSLATFPEAFAANDFSAGNLANLKASMQETLVKAGLYPEEASAMLRTWELSYFKSPGLRFFYVAPNSWVDKVLPLNISGATTNITRVMVGRIELISPAQRATLARLAVGPCPDLAAIKSEARDAVAKGPFTDEQRKAFYDGERPLSELGISLPPLVRDYLALGRFRDELIVHEQKEHPSAALAQFIADNRLDPGGR